ncbi:DUF255 domain-containing protein [bacterium]|nr:DUF255 domain-containing protein [bacterium]
MHSTLIISLLSCLSVILISCKDEENPSGKIDRFDKDDFFADAEEAISLDSFKNEMGDTSTDFLRSFAKDEIAWQKWDQSILEKARSAQSPIMMLVGSSKGGISRKVGKRLSDDPGLRKLVSKQSLATVVDIYAFPEIGMLSYHLSAEMKRATAFPFLIWLSHEGAPIAWTPIGDLSAVRLEFIVSNAVALVEDTWTRYSEYAVENSREDNEGRQRRFDAKIEQAGSLKTRDEIFRDATRQLSSLYSFGDRDLDYIGGLIPTSSLELLAIGSQSDLLTDEVREQCKQAATEVTYALFEEGIKDQLDHSYFFARRSSAWDLPSLSKNISSQATVAHMLIRVGSILDDQRIIEEGLSTLSVIENLWLSKPLSSLSPNDSPDDPGKFLWDFKTLKEVLTEDQFQTAVAAYSLKENGNIPPSVDPLEDFYKLNTLRRRVPLGELAAQQQKTVPELKQALGDISKKLLAHRKEVTTFDSESTMSVTDMAIVLNAQIARANLPSGDQLQSALTQADRILKDFIHPEKGLTRFGAGNVLIPARCGDYATTANAFFSLYQATLDEKWLKHSLKTLDEAMTRLASENGLLSEVPSGDRIIPIRQHNKIMIFGDSSLGTLDHSLNRAWAITGDEKYRDMLALHAENINPGADLSPVNHTDYLASCALGTHPLIAVMQGDPEGPAGQKFLSLLNSQKYLPFLSIRPANETDTGLANTSAEEPTTITMIRNGKVLGNASSAADLEPLLQQIISGT